MKNAFIIRLFSAPIQRGLSSPLWVVMFVGVLFWSGELLAQTGKVTVPWGYYLNWQGPQKSGGTHTVDKVSDYPIEVETGLYSDSDGRDCTYQTLVVGGALPRAQSMLRVRSGRKDIGWIEAGSKIYYYFGIYPRWGNVAGITQVPVHVRLCGSYTIVTEGPGGYGTRNPFASAKSTIYDGTSGVIVQGSCSEPGVVHKGGYDKEYILTLEVAKVYSAEVWTQVVVQPPLHVTNNAVYAEAEAIADPLIEIDPAFPQIDSFMIVFSENLNPPQLSITAQGTNALLSWSASHAGFTLQCSSNPGPSSVWNVVPIEPMSVDGQNIVTNPVCEPSMTFRLFRQNP